MTIEQKRIRELEYWLFEAEKTINYQMGIMTQTHGPTHKMTEGLRAMAWKLSDMRTNATRPDCPSCDGEGFVEYPEFEVNACESCGGSGELPNVQAQR